MAKSKRAARKRAGRVGKVPESRKPPAAEPRGDIAFDEPASPLRQMNEPQQKLPERGAGEDAVDSFGLPGRTRPSSSDLN